ncbi:hypothetical protein KKH27_11640 [bacterium]|nr:hypothetical protein [bacterium]MBU1985266.1 hypothetical protein [bacterium]
MTGKLSFDPILGATLKVVGSFQELTSLPQEFEAPIIHGVTEQRKFTLANCFQTGFQMSVPGVVITRLVPGLILEGWLFERLEDIHFNELSFGFTNLEDWIGIRALKTTHEADESGLLKGYNISFVKPPDILIDLDECAIEIGLNVKTSGDVHSQTIKKVGIVTVRTKEDVDLDWFHGHAVAPIMKFVSLGLGVPVRLTYMNGRNPNLVTTLERIPKTSEGNA